MATVVVPTIGRNSLRSCVQRILEQEVPGAHQVIVVDDSKTGNASVRLGELTSLVEVIVSGGVGPAGARNAGVRGARADVVFFTDDDVHPQPGWIAAGLEYLRTHVETLGVEGPIDTPAFDYLYEQSLENGEPGAFWTCNIAYRRSAFEAVGGFAPDFPWPHGEDLDLAFRVLERGPIGFAQDMRVTHLPRRVSVKDFVLQGRWVVSSITLMQRHPGRYPAGGIIRQSVWQLTGGLRHWARRIRDDRQRFARSPQLLLRVAVIAAGHAAVSAAAIIRWQVGLRTNRRKV